MVGFEVRDAKGNITFSTEHSTWLVLHSSIIKAQKSGVIEVMIEAPANDFTEMVATLHPTEYLMPDTGAVMPDYKLINSTSSKGVVTINFNGTHPDCLLTVLGR